jgi:hypothetical protein
MVSPPIQWKDPNVNPPRVEPKRSPTEITYKGFGYDVRSQFGVDSLRAAIERNGDA